MSEKSKGMEVTFRGKVIKCVYNSPSFKIYAIDFDEKEYPYVKKNRYGNASITGELPDLVEDVEYDIRGVYPTDIDESVNDFEEEFIS